MTDGSITGVGIVRARLGREDELGRRLDALLVPTRAEPGCLAYDLFRCTDDPSIWVLIEFWRSAEDLDAHVLSPHMTAFFASSADVVSRPPNSFRLTRSDQQRDRRDPP